MQGDEARPDNATGPAETRSGPRHAAPRKSLLTRVHMPAGKAIALAAMPTAVLMGMGLTPRLAQADELPKNPFKGSSCVTQSDTPAPQSSASATPSATAAPTPKQTAAAAPQKTATAQPPSGGGSGSPAATPTASPSPSPTRTTNPLDPLGLGNLLGGVVNTLTGSGGTPTTAPATAAPTPSASPTAASGTGGSTGTAKTPLLGTVQKAVGAVGGAAAQPLPTATATPAPAASPTPGQGYPCPTYNAQALADASLEQTPELLPDQPWILKTDLLTLTGLDYHGVVKVRTWDGTVKNVLKFTATGVDIRNLHQITDGPNGIKFHVQARAGSTSTIRNGTVTMYTEELKGNLFGLIPVTFTPNSPPPLNVSAAFFTNVTVTQAGQFGGVLTIPGMHLYGGT